MNEGCVAWFLFMLRLDCSVEFLGGFRLNHTLGLMQDHIEQIGDKLARTYLGFAILGKWFTIGSPMNWRPNCDIYVKIYVYLGMC